MHVGDKGNKIKTSISISGYLNNKMGDLIKQKRFASKSDIITTALGEFFGRLELQEEFEENKCIKVNLMSAFEAFLQTENGKTTLHKIILNDNRAATNDNNNNNNKNRIKRQIIIE